MMRRVDTVTPNTSQKRLFYLAGAVVYPKQTCFKNFPAVGASCGEVLARRPCSRCDETDSDALSDL